MGNTYYAPSAAESPPPTAPKGINYDDDDNWGWLPGKVQHKYARYDPASVFATHTRNMTTNVVTPVSYGKGRDVEDTNVDVFFVHVSRNTPPLLHRR